MSAAKKDEIIYIENERNKKWSQTESRFDAFSVHIYWCMKVQHPIGGYVQTHRPEGARLLEWAR